MVRLSPGNTLILIQVTYHLAQLNIGRLKHPAEDPRVAGFFDELDRINALAEESPAFVWRLQSDSGNATDIDVFGDPLEIVNLSVWESVEHLKAFTYRTDHRTVFRQRHDWFEPKTQPHLVLWWLKAGHLPDTDEAVKRLEHLRAHGPSERAFTFSSVQPAPSDAGSEPG